ncbi:hypothetical protein F5Y04DRAFT_247704 [Hypomontagnella monticulosa]|nr:hypothetical protein F5Y04DRAFT_247704 [Hypomontagnella monticulosa]
MQAVINQLRGAAKERQRWEEDAKKARIELEVAKIRIADLENELDQGPEAPEETVKQDHVIAAYGMRDQKKTDEAENKNGGLEDANNSPAERPANQEEQGRACDDVICLHHVAWGSGSIHDKALDRRLLDCAAHNSSFTVTREFIGRGVRTGERRTLVIAYSVPPDGSMRWLVVDEGHKGRFDR